jgi:hypothetical protein
LTPGSSPEVWTDYDASVAAQFPFVNNFNAATLEAQLGLAYPIDQNDANLALYRTSATAFEWKIKMRYYTAID